MVRLHELGLLIAAVFRKPLTAAPSDAEAILRDAELDMPAAWRRLAAASEKDPNELTDRYNETARLAVALANRFLADQGEPRDSALAPAVACEQD